jgi:glycerol uptake facilitator-like aquaporin
VPLSLARRALAEFIGTALLVAAVIGSGIAAARFSPGNLGLELFENAVATGAALVAIILAVGPVSGAHLNPVITLIDRFFGGIGSRDAWAYVAAQVAGGLVGAVIANLMFGLDALQISAHVRSGGGLWLGEAVATFGLALVVFGVVRSGRSGVAPFAVGAYIGAAYFFTSSTSFANPAVTIARIFSDTFAGIAPSSVLAFVAFQLVGAVAASGTIHTLYPGIRRVTVEPFPTSRGS